MKKYNFNFSPEKNQKLIYDRGISFEEAISAIENNCLIDIVEHPNSKKYSNQKIYIVEISNYIYLVPHITEDNGIVFLKTIIPSRKATKKYLN